MKKSEIISEKAAKILLDIQAVKFNITEPFLLTSGKRSPVYCDCRKIISFPNERNFLINSAIKILKDQAFFNSIDVVAGGETAGIPFASFLAEKLNLSMIYIRKKTKEFGRKKKIEGSLDHYKKVILVEDLITDGGSKIDFIETLLKEKSEILCILVIFNYGIYGDYFLNKESKIKLLYLTNWKYIINEAYRRKLLKSNERDIVKKFLDDFGVKS